MTLLNLFIAGCLAWFIYKLVCMAIEAIKLAVQQADHLEQEFGRDVIGAAKYMILGQPGAAGELPHGPKGRMPDDG